MFGLSLNFKFNYQMKRRFTFDVPPSEQRKSSRELAVTQQVQPSPSSVQRLSGNQFTQLPTQVGQRSPQQLNSGSRTILLPEIEGYSKVSTLPQSNMENVPMRSASTTSQQPRDYSIVAQDSLGVNSNESQRQQKVSNEYFEMEQQRKSSNPKYRRINSANMADGGEGTPRNRGFDASENWHSRLSKNTNSIYNVGDSRGLSINPTSQLSSPISPSNRSSSPRFRSLYGVYQSKASQSLVSTKNNPEPEINKPSLPSLPMINSICNLFGPQAYRRSTNNPRRIEQTSHRGSSPIEGQKFGSELTVRTTMEERMNDIGRLIISDYRPDQNEADGVSGFKAKPRGTVFDQTIDETSSAHAPKEVFAPPKPLKTNTTIISSKLTPFLHIKDTTQDNKPRENSTKNEPIIRVLQPQNELESFYGDSMKRDTMSSLQFKRPEFRISEEVSTNKENIYKSCHNCQQSEDKLKLMSTQIQNAYFELSQRERANQEYIEKLQSEVNKSRNELSQSEINLLQEKSKFFEEKAIRFERLLSEKDEQLRKMESAMQTRVDTLTRDRTTLTAEAARVEDLKSKVLRLERDLVEMELSKEGLKSALGSLECRLSLKEQELESYARRYNDQAELNQTLKNLIEESNKKIALLQSDAMNKTQSKIMGEGIRNKDLLEWVDILKRKEQEISSLKMQINSLRMEKSSPGTQQLKTIR
jgi:hypothetical protein